MVQLQVAKRIRQKDLLEGAGRVMLPEALARRPAMQEYQVLQRLILRRGADRQVGLPPAVTPKRLTQLPAPKDNGATLGELLEMLKMRRSNRREFCRTLVAGAAGLPLMGSLRGAFAQSGGPALTTTKLTDRFTLISGAGSNVLLVSGPDSALMVNGGTAERSAEVLKVAGDLAGGKPIQTLFNTDWHLDITGSNDTLGKAGAKIIAHENTRLWMSTEFHVQWQNRTYKPRAKEALPNQTFYTTAKMSFAGQDIQYGQLGQAHTDGDIFVYFPGQNILVTGDVFTVGAYPILDWSTGGWIGGLSEAHRTLVALTNAETRVVPGHGPVQTKADLEGLAEMTSTMRTRFVDMMRKGMSAADMFRAAPTKDYDAKWGDPKQFIANAYPGLWNHVRELGGIV